ncbi:F-box/kelch-repeat protein At1g51550 [Cynara cardunculus var. scolymus]|uniref:F-box domain, cyclin-like protein n=1 Tax=Cynara cardunculus var. scolymus TaxID=59895 RepID=A0A118K3F0_CYNCS|nr:F-box/kelch-repeat protein At1g51550 [Cynara cardunculus var. scolymus]KVI05837.1 F-box domain, cyclin-like protein [Cynara cardunculus var. scolymus]
MADDVATSSSIRTNFDNNGGDAASFITNLSHDHLFSILLLLPLDSILSFAMTCKKTTRLTHSHTLWKSICTRDWGHSTVDALLTSSSSSSLDWKRLYQRLRNLDRVSCFNLTDPDAQGPTPRASHSLNFFSGCLVLFGGGSEGGRHLDDTWIAYVGNGFRRMMNWQRVISDGPSGRFGHSCVVIGDCLVLFGGINDSGIRQNDTWIAQVAIDETNSSSRLSWRLLDVGPVAPPTRGAHACCSIDNQRMLIHGGIGLSGMRLGDTWVLHLSENLCFGTWHETVTHPVPSPRSGHTLTYIGGSRTVLFGGRGMGYEVLNDVWYLDSSEDRLGWVPVVFELRNIPGGLSLPRVGHSATLILGGRVVIYGGEDSYRHRKNDFWLLDIGSKRTWRRLKSEGYEGRSRSFHRACADESGCNLYVFGGMVDGILHPAEPAGLRFDGELFVVELVL